MAEELARWRLRRGTAAAWAASNTILRAGEEGYESDTGRRKVGDGATAWNSLPYDQDVYATVAAAEAAKGVDNYRCYVVETESFYRYEATGSGYTVNHLDVLATGDAGNTRWLAVAGKYVCGPLIVTGAISGASAAVSGDFGGRSLVVGPNRPLIQVVHGGKRAISAGNTGLGQGRPPFSKVAQSSEITGTRTSDTVFTRSAGTWVVDALIGQYVFSYASGSPATGVWLQITDNNATTVTVSGTLHATGTAVVTSLWCPIAGAYAHGQVASAFESGVFDGVNLWLAPYASTNLIKVNISTGGMTTYAHGQANWAFSGAVFDGTSVWLIPNNGANILKVNPATGGMTPYAHGQGAWAFVGGVFDGENIWMAPAQATNVVKFNPATGAITTYAHGQATYAFKGAVFDGAYIWLIPLGSSNLVRVDPATGGMTTYAHGAGANAFTGGVFDGENICMVPYGSASVIKINPATGGMTTYAHGCGSSAFVGGVFDGVSIWLVPYNSTKILKLNPATGAMTAFYHGQGSYPFKGAVFDGEHVWLIPHSGANLVKLRPPELGRAA